MSQPERWAYDSEGIRIHENEARCQASQNIETWGKQELDTLLLAMTEEIGELTQAYLESEAEGEPPSRQYKELTDLWALMYQYADALLIEERVQNVRVE